MKKNDRPYWAILFFVCAVALGSLFYAIVVFNRAISKSAEILNRETPSESGKIENSRLFWIELDFGNGKKRLFEIGVRDESYPLKPALITTAEFGKFQIEMREDGTIESIGGVKGRWGIYQSGDKISDSVEDLAARGGDRFVLRVQ